VSASEKLKALEAEERDSDLWHALPQIVAVVEAAETDLRDGGRANARALAAALAALEDALS